MRSGPGKTARHIALLRGINLGGRNSLPMARLVSIFETIGCQGVRTYIQSGNVVFEAPATLARQVPGLVADAIADQTGLAVPIMTRSAAEIQRLVDANPFVKPGADLSVLHVGFLAARPTRAQLAALDPDRSPPDGCVSDGRELYLRCPNGLARTKFTNAYFDRTLGTVSTIRNWPRPEPPDGPRRAMSPPDWFSPSYEIARRRFREAAAAIGAVAERYAVETGGQDTDLTIDVVTVGSAAPRRVVIVSSGLHGVEGFFGSAIQLAWLARLVGGAAPPADGAVVLVHGLNPYGFARLRRTDAGNVDLNRNFLDTDEAYDGAPARYAALDRFLNPTSPPSRAEPFTLKALWYIRRFGLPALKEAVASGQYLFPRGLFFGGRGPAPSAQIVRRHLATWVGSAPRVLHLDLHSGLGAHGGHRLLLLESADAPDVEWYRDTFGRDVVEPAADGARTAYAASGTLGGWAQRHLRGTRYRFVNAEFGTYSIVRVLGALRAENRAHFFGRPGTASYRQAKTELLECFCPRSHRWREQVVKAGLALLDRAVEAQTP